MSAVGWAAIRRNRIFRLLVLVAALMLAQIAIEYSLADTVRRFGPANAPAVLVIGVIIGALALLFIYADLVSRLEKRPVPELAPGAAPSGLAGGAAIGILLFAGVIGAMWSLGIAAIAPASSSSVIGSFAGAVLSGVGEELMFRGALFRLAEECFGTSWALAISALMFGAVHGSNPHATVVSSTAIAVEAGLLLAFAYTATRALWLPIGLHFGWNFAEAGIFGSVISGFPAAGLLRTTTSGPAMLSGGAFGPEASVIAIGVCLAAAVPFAIITVRRSFWRSATLSLQAA